MRMNLRRLILLVAFVSAFLSLANSFYASYRVQRQLLINSTLEANHAYAEKLANSTEDFLQAALQQLAYSAEILGGKFGDQQLLQSEVSRLRLQTHSFNSVLVVDVTGLVRAVSPETLEIKDRQLNSAGAIEALRERRPLVSKPYVSAVGNLVIFISHPVVDGKGNYLGYVGGTIYLKQKSSLSRLLGEHYYRDGSYLYVVDQSRRLLYHPDPARLGKVTGPNAVIDAIVRGEGGSQRLFNSQGVDMLAGYAVLPLTGWGIVAQRPASITLEPLNELMLDVLHNSLPIALLTLLFIWWLARLISRPLGQLAEGASRMDVAATSEHIQAIRSWYFEAAQIKRAMLAGLALLHQKIGKLNVDVQTDPMTGLNNRRGMDSALETWQAERRGFSIVALDIDRFKQINDTLGHDAGDMVIKHLALLMRTCSRDADVLCRNGGDEFLMLLPDTPLDAALRVAERLRLRVEESVLPGIGDVTISLGAAAAPPLVCDPQRVLKAADAALYDAKQQGRNRVAAAPPAV
ncbi:diguanylate cyclase domain protein [Janthinobacterium agaricidamnosum NBRC 102515 = DSM 9628]|uniref:diguanylate cyclase n=1 Tax=Janthinobacterium agaricidamnosum NBRC 102515 = DSM 9628 TaxID=1349767 RepID=W0V6Q7_9BURK|nr:diguanylate cyclase domain protein [Janthinobacterium agaricidamnosum NBRC 102515 = DSM 9628]